MLAQLPELEGEEYPLEITLQVPECHCICPFNGQEDTFVVRVVYTPLSGRVLELAAFRDYLLTFTGTAISHEVLTANLLGMILETVVPAYCLVETTWAPVEGVACTVRAVTGA